MHVTDGFGFQQGDAFPVIEPGGLFATITWLPNWCDSRPVWTPFARTQDNTGRYVWRMPPGVPYQFHVRVEATDRAGNVGTAETTEPVKVDLNRPKTRVLTVDPVSK